MSKAQHRNRVAAVVVFVIAFGAFTAAVNMSAHPSQMMAPTSPSTPFLAPNGDPAWNGFPFDGDGAPDAADCMTDGLAAPSNPEELSTRLHRVADDYEAQFQASWYEPGTGIVTTGDLTNLPAWSTAKVPLSLAVVQDGQGDALAPSISAALQGSDNEAADVLWRSLGDDDATRAEAVTAVFRQADDDVTFVPTSALRPPFSVFGQTQWSTAAQVGFLTQLPCLVGADQIIQDMAGVTDSQRWGLGVLPEATFKGGWGPEDADGGELVRQFGWYTDTTGRIVPVALAVRATSFGTGVAVLDEFAAMLTT